MTVESLLQKVESFFNKQQKIKTGMSQVPLKVLYISHFLYFRHHTFIYLN